MKRIPGQRKDGFDKRKFGGKTYYAWGEYRLGTVGKAAVEKEVARMKKHGHKARIVKHVTGYQAYCDSESGAMGQ